MSKYNILLLIANHTCSNIKYNISLSNISVIRNFVKNIVIVDTKNEHYAKLLYNDLKYDSKILHHFFVDNDNYFDFGKWNYALNNINISNYDYVLFLNDSIIVTHIIENYFIYIDTIMSSNIDLYAYNDSSQIKYHYQSYLFLIKALNINTFINFFESKKNLISGLESLVINVELNMTNIYENHDVFLKIGNEWNKSKNLYWENEELYSYLLSKNIFAIIKLKKIFDIQKEYKLTIHSKNIDNFDYDFYKSYYELNDYNNQKLLNHFLKIGQFQGYKYNKDFTTMLPKYYRTHLESLGLLYFFDVPDDFDVYYYKKNNDDLSKHSIIEVIKHYIYYGFNEGRIYDKNNKNNNEYLNKFYEKLLLNYNFTISNNNYDDYKDYNINHEKINLYCYNLLNNYFNYYGNFGVFQKYIFTKLNFNQLDCEGPRKCCSQVCWCQF